MQPTVERVESLKPVKNIRTVEPDTQESIIDEKRDRSNYDAYLPRKFVESICGISTNTLVKLEKDGTIKSKKINRAGVDYCVYEISDIHRILKYKKISYKSKTGADVITVFSQKGGVGKSSFTQHLGSMFSLVGKTLIVDLDAQGDATSLFGLDAKYGDVLDEDEEVDPTIAELMDWTLSTEDEAPYDRHEFHEVVKTISPSLDIIPADLDLGEINYSLNRLPLKPRIDENGKEHPGALLMVKEIIDKIRDKYDFIILDCPPNIETCNVSALFASERLIIPLELEAKCLRTMRRNLFFLERLKSLHPGFSWEKILIVPNKNRNERIKTKANLVLRERYSESDEIDISTFSMPVCGIVDWCANEKEPIFNAATRFGAKSKSWIPKAQEFSNYFWNLMHEVLDRPVERKPFDLDSGEGA